MTPGWRTWPVVSGARAGLVSMLLAGAVSAAAQTLELDDGALAALGGQLYREGLDAEHRPLQAERDNGLLLRGREAACIQCHRASGMGGAEGSNAVPPIVGSMLFEPGHATRPRAARVFSRLTRQTPASEARPAYTLDSLQRALNQGVGASGQRLDPLMPRYRLTPQEIRALAAYTMTLRVGTGPGLVRRSLHLATVDTVGTTRSARQAGPELLERCLAERSPRPATDDADPPDWILHRWTLGADPQRWPQELATLQGRQPVFALVSGSTGPSGRGAWQAVQAHCEREAMPCILPNTAAVDDLQPSAWTFHFSPGASLDAAAMAETLSEHAPADGWRSVHLVVDPHSEAAGIGARRLTERLRAGIGANTDFRVHRPDAGDTARWLAGLGARDALVLWLPAAMLHEWTERQPVPPALTLVLVSGELAELEAGALASRWRSRTRITWPYDSAERHLPRIAQNLGGWLDAQRLPLADSPALLRLQGHTYSACAVTANALRRMGSRVSRAYLVELLEGAEEAATTTAYPRFTLGPGRRHGSQGTWLLGFSDPPQARLQPVGDWFVPE